MHLPLGDSEQQHQPQKTEEKVLKKSKRKTNKTLAEVVSSTHFSSKAKAVAGFTLRYLEVGWP